MKKLEKLHEVKKRLLDAESTIIALHQTLQEKVNPHNYGEGLLGIVKDANILTDVYVKKWGIRVK